MDTWTEYFETVTVQTPSEEIRVAVENGVAVEASVAFWEEQMQ